MTGGGAKTSEERVVEPNEVDILCGRGGLSNHHPGNEWYRRLIRSNRPLYRACPKHTKLLVSKAIVQAVEQQGGRFLERSRKDGFWYAVPYKKAVDKTSQGLRERDRDDDQAAIALPQEFSGQSSHALSDLADVAMAHATRMDGLPRSASELVTADGTLKRPMPPSMPRAVAVRAVPPPAAAVARPPPKLKDNMSPSSTSAAAAAAAAEQFNPLPPHLETRQSSMFRLLKDTKLLPGESAWGMGPDSFAQRSPAATPALPTTLNNLPGAANNTAATAAYGMGRAGPQYGSGNAFSPAAAPPPPAAPPAPVAAPALTRLTTQVSDWLNSFWPVPVKNDAAAAAKAPPSASAPSGVPANSVINGAIRKGEAPPIVNIPPPAPTGPIHINTIPPMKQPLSDKKTNDDSLGKSSIRHPGNPAVTPPPLDAAEASTALAAAAGAPTELEHSVSATLLKLAGSPSKLFPGISALFRDESRADASAPPKDPKPSATNLSAPIAGTKRSKASLLDDDDDDDDNGTAMMRGASPSGTGMAKKQKTSLLDDYEESPMEVRMRNL